MGSPGVVEGKQTRRYCWLRRSLPWLSAPPSPRPLPMQIRLQTLLLTRGMDTTDGAATAATMAATTDPTDTMDTTARGLLMPSPLPMPTLLLTPGMDTTATATDPGDTTDPTDTATTTARGLLTPSPSPLPLLIPLPTRCRPLVWILRMGRIPWLLQALRILRILRLWWMAQTLLWLWILRIQAIRIWLLGTLRRSQPKLNIVLSLPTNTTEDQFLQN